MSAKISIITVTFNNVKNLQKTIYSISQQLYSAIEFIIVDGKSTDGTFELIENNGDIIDKWISEPDKGIYDAMNKGLRMATGDYVWFINAGDEIFTTTTISEIFKNADVFADVYYGQTMVIDEKGNEIGLRRLKPPQNLTWKSYQFGQLVSHQSFIAKRELAPFYDLKYNHSADTDWQIKILKRSGIIVNSHRILSRYLKGGQSSRTIFPSLKERFIIMIKNYGLIKTILNHFIIGIKFLYFLVRFRRF